MPNLLIDRSPDVFSTADVARALRTLWPSVNLRMERGMVRGTMMAFLVAVSDDVAAKLERLKNAKPPRQWWQEDNHLWGVGSGASKEECWSKAIQCARLGEVARANLTVYFVEDANRREFVICNRGDRDSDSGQPLSLRPSDLVFV